MKTKNIIALLIFLLTFNMLYSAETDNVYNNKYWEGISIEILVKELLTDAEKEGLKNFTAFARGNYISIVYRDIIFKPDSPELTDETKVKLKILVKILKKFASKTFFIEGHTNKVVGEEELGLVLSKKRAEAVSSFLTNTDIFRETKFLTKGYGDTQPVSETNYSLNRRVEISIVDKIEDKNDNNNTNDARNIWWKTLTDEKSPNYTVIVVKNEARNKDNVIKALNRKKLNYKIYVKDKDLIIIIEDLKFKKDSDELDDSSKIALKSVDEVINKYKNIIIRVSGIKDYQYDQAVKNQYNVAIYIYKNFTKLRPEYIYYSYNGESLENEKKKEPFAENDDKFTYNKLLESVDCTIIQSNPLGRFREFSLAGLGIGFMINMKIPAFEKIPVASRLRFSLEANGLYHFPETTSSVEAVWEFSWDIGIGIKFVDISYFGFLLRTKYGGVVNILTATRQSYGHVTGKMFYDQTVSIESEFDIRTKKRTEQDKLIISIFLTPGYRLFFNKDYLGHAVYGKTGIRFNF